MSAVPTMALGALAALAASSCGIQAQTPAVNVGACLTNDVADRIRFDMNSKLPSEEWSAAAGIAKMAGRGRVCLDDGRAWPSEGDVAFSVVIDPPVSEVSMTLAGIEPPPFYAKFDCGAEIRAGETPRVEDVEFEFVRARVGFECRVRREATN